MGCQLLFKYSCTFLIAIVVVSQHWQVVQGNSKDTVGVTFSVEFDSNKPLGLGLTGANPVKVSGFQRDNNGLAQAGEKDGKIKIGDELLSINGERISTINDVVAHLRKKDSPKRRLLFRAFDGKRRESIEQKMDPTLEQVMVLCPSRRFPWSLVSLAQDTRVTRFPVVPSRIVQSDPLDACGEITNEYDVRGAIVIVNRGTCTFHEKAFNLQLLGATGVVVIGLDDDLSEQLAVADANGSPIKIPVGLMTKTKGSALSAAVQTYNGKSVDTNCLLVAKEQYDNGRLEFPVGERGSTESEFEWWLNQYRLDHPDESMKYDTSKFTEPTNADALEVYFHLNSIPEAKLALHDFASESVNEFLADKNGRKVEAITGHIGKTLKTCVWECGKQQPVTPSALFLESNKTALALIGTAQPSDACDETSLVIQLPISIQNVLADGSLLDTTDHGLLGILVTRGGECPFDVKLQNVHRALERQLGGSILTNLSVMVFIVNSKNGLFAVDPTVSTKTHPHLGVTAMIPKYTDRLVTSLVERALDTHAVLATIKVATLEEPDVKKTPPSEKSCDTELRSKVAFEWNRIQQLTENVDMWETDKKVRKKQYKKLALLNHPDKGGSQDRFEALLFAYKRASFLLDRDEDADLEGFDDMA